MGTNMERTWFISVSVTDLSVDKTLRVSGDLHIGGVMYKIVQSLAVTADWSDHGLWWPEKSIWLNKPKLTLTQYGVQAEAKLQFTPMHKIMKVQLPDLQLLHLKINFSVSVYNAVVQLCKEMGIRYPEELSFLKPVGNHKDKDKKALGPITQDGQSFKRSSRASSSSNGSLNKGSSPTSPHSTPQRTPVHIQPLSGTLLRTPQTPGSPGSWVNGMSPMSLTRSLSFDDTLFNQLVNSPWTPSKEAFLYLNKCKNLLDKALVQGGWLDSNKSLMEQGVTESDQLHFKFKYFSFYDLNPKYDPVRINQIYEQAKWSLISEELDCTEQEMMMFAALQLQVELQATSSRDVVDSSRHEEQDEIDAALNDLQVSLEGMSAHQTGDITQVPELQEYIKHFKPKKYTMKGAKRYYAVLRDTVIYFHKSKDDINHNSLHHISLKDCDIQPDVNLSSQKFVIKLYLPTSDGLVEEWLKCESEDQYAKWMAACKLGSKGHTMADSSFNAEVKSIEQFLSLQKPSSPVQSVAKAVSVSKESIDASDYVAPRYAKKNKAKVTQRIIDAHANVKDMSLVEAKLNYIKAWQALPEYGLTYFLVRFRNSKKEEVIGIGYNRLVRMNPKTADVTRTYRFSTMSSWSVHWENQEVMVDFEEEKLAIKPLSASCKVFHEFIGGYIFLSMRSFDKTQTLNEDMFTKLTSGTCT